mmetsp:Transcript_60101/g.113422  ORF Transcript_60101/g.113422 Transcript_60101/m.113422 type:complete len:255 (-) Transcript_60101:196-960(-)
MVQHRNGIRLAPEGRSQLGPKCPLQLDLQCFQAFSGAGLQRFHGSIQAFRAAFGQQLDLKPVLLQTLLQRLDIASERVSLQMSIESGREAGLQLSMLACEACKYLFQLAQPVVRLTEGLLLRGMRRLQAARLLQVAVAKLTEARRCDRLHLQHLVSVDFKLSLNFDNAVAVILLVAPQDIRHILVALLKVQVLLLQPAHRGLVLRVLPLHLFELPDPVATLALQHGFVAGMLFRRGRLRVCELLHQPIKPAVHF